MPLLFFKFQWIGSKQAYRLSTTDQMEEYSLRKCFWFCCQSPCVKRSKHFKNYRQTLQNQIYTPRHCPSKRWHPLTHALWTHAYKHTSFKRIYCIGPDGFGPEGKVLGAGGGLAPSWRSVTCKPERHRGVFSIIKPLIC